MMASLGQGMIRIIKEERRQGQSLSRVSLGDDRTRARINLRTAGSVPYINEGLVMSCGGEVLSWSGQ